MPFCQTGIQSGDEMAPVGGYISETAIEPLPELEHRPACHDGIDQEHVASSDYVALKVTGPAKLLLRLIHSYSSPTRRSDFIRSSTGLLGHKG